MLVFFMIKRKIILGKIIYFIGIFWSSYLVVEKEVLE